MEEKELNQKLHEMFKEMSLVLEDTKQGFLTQNQTTLKKADAKLTEILTSNLPFTEELAQKRIKDEVEKKYLNLLPNLQLMAVIIRNLISENKKKIEASLLFTDKAIDEIKHLYTLMLTQFEDTTDYTLTRNPHLRMHIKTGMENLFERVEDCIAEHETRLVTCGCIPKASYSYVAIIDSVKGLSRELNNFSEKLA
jgi:Na+/phosphate symporter